MKKVLAAILAVVTVVSALSVSAFAIGKKKSEFSDEWKAMVKKNYDEFIAEVDGDSSKIPMIVSTDQHGSIKANSQLYKYIDEITDWSKISKIINLGDTVQNTYSASELFGYRIATMCLPGNKRIEVVGNHDRGGLKLGFIADIFFPTPGAKRGKTMNDFVVTDKKFNVRYLAVDPKTSPWNYTSGRITKKQADFIVAELSKNDSSDIIMLSHPYLFKDKIITRFGTTFTGSEFFIGSADEFTDVKQSFLDMLLARKNKTSGVFTDCEGVEHPYDFSKCKSDFIMALHGHHHKEGYETSNGITQFLFQSMRYDEADDNEPNCFYFAYIDRDTKTFKCWKNVEGYDAWEFDIA